MKIAFIVQRYGTEILGGSEYHCRLIAERLASRHQVEVLTTCAQDYITWKNEYPEGLDRIRGVTIRRFPTAHTRDLQAFNRYSEWIFNNQHQPDEELEWLKQQGPWSPALLDYVERRHGDYDTLIFFTYLYAPTVLGVRTAPERTILVPTAHDEPAIHLDIYKDVFRLPRAIAYNTEVERRFLKDTFRVGATIEETVGCGVDLPQYQAYERARNPEDDASAVSDEGDAVIPRDATDETIWRSHVASRGATFRRRHRIQQPFVLYGGRIDPGKGCEELLEYFNTYVEEAGDATLVLMGLKLMRIPEDPSIRFAGMLSEQERVSALEAATVVVVPSPYESLSLLALEAFAVGTPILANARSEVLVDHCLNSNAGLFYSDRDEFVEGLKLLVADARLRAAMGRNGREYVRRNYRWDVILGKYERLMAGIRGRADTASVLTGD